MRDTAWKSEGLGLRPLAVKAESAAEAQVQTEGFQKTGTGPADDNTQMSMKHEVVQKPENYMLGFLWLLYLSWLATTGST